MKTLLKLLPILILSFSFSQDYLLDSRVLEWTFNNIMLPDSTVNGELSKGFISFKVKQNMNLSNGIVINNSADIYFDFNEPVITNQTFHTINSCIENSTITTISVTSSGAYFWELANQTITQTGTYHHVLQNMMGCDSIIRLNATIDDVSVFENQFDQQISIYPNPTSSILHIDFKDVETKNLQIELLDLTGKQIVKITRLQLKNEIHISELLSKGTYFLTVKDSSDNVLARKKVVLQ